VGRRDLLEALAGATGKASAAAAQAITGPAGVGKTRLAVEYAYSHCDDFDVVWWVRAEQPTTLRGDLAALAGQLGLRSASLASLDSTVREVRAWLADHDRWMVVADNAEAVHSVSAVLPEGGRGQVLVTSRNGDWDDAAELLDVGVFGDDEAVEYLLSCSRQPDRAAALALARALGCLPLALEKAGAYIAEHPGLGIGGYQEMFEAREIQLRAREIQLRAREIPLRAREIPLRAREIQEPTESGPPRPYPTSVAISCTLCVEAVEEVSPLAVTLLRASAFLAPEAVPLSLLSGADELPEPLAGGPLAQRDALAALSRMGLARSTWAGGIAVDRVVQAVVRDNLAADGERTSTPFKGAIGPWVAGVIRLVDRAFPPDSDDVSTWDRCSRLVPHALAVTAHAEAVDLEPQATSRLLARVGIYLQSRGELPEARGLLEAALAIAEVTYGPECAEAGIHLGNLAAVLQDMGDLAGARLCLERAVAIAEATHGDDHPAVGIFVANLGSVLAELGQPGPARLCFERALAIDGTVYGPKHPAVAGDLSNLGLVLWTGGDALDARRCFDQALSIDEATYGADDPTVARDLANLALVVAELGELGEALRGLERALAIVESAFGPAHPQVTPHLNNLAMVLQDAGRFAEARGCLERALAIAEEHDGPRHPSVAGVLNNLATVLSQIGEATVARLCLDRALAIDEAALGRDHPEVVGIRDNRARLLRELGPDGTGAGAGGSTV